MHRGVSNENGSTIISILFALPIICVVVFAIVDIGRAELLSSSLNDAASAVREYVEQRPQSVPSQNELENVAFQAAPALDSSNLELEVVIAKGRVQDNVYEHKLYDSTGSYEKRESHTETRPCRIVVTLKGEYLTPVGNQIAALKGRDDGTFVLVARTKGSLDTTVEGGAW